MQKLYYAFRAGFFHSESHYKYEVLRQKLEIDPQKIITFDATVLNSKWWSPSNYLPSIFPHYSKSELLCR